MGLVPIVTRAVVEDDISFNKTDRLCRYPLETLCIGSWWWRVFQSFQILKLGIDYSLRSHMLAVCVRQSGWMKVPCVPDSHCLKNLAVRPKDIVASLMSQIFLAYLPPRLLMPETQRLPEVN